MKIEMKNDFLLIRRFVGEKKVGGIILEQKESKDWYSVAEPNKKIIGNEYAIKPIPNEQVDGEEDYKYAIINNKEIFMIIEE